MTSKEQGAPAKPATSRGAALGASMIAALVGFGVGLLVADSDDEGGTQHAADPRPVSRAYDPDRPGRTVLGGGALGASVAFRAGTLDAVARIVLDRDPPVEGPPPPFPEDPEVRITNLTDYFNVDARRKGAVNTGGDWDPPLELVIDVPESAAKIPDKELIACFYSTAGKEHAWKPIAELRRGARLAAGARDGFYLTGSGAKRKAHIRSRHLTIFSLFRARKVKG